MRAVRIIAKGVANLRDGHANSDRVLTCGNVRIVASRIAAIALTSAAVGSCGGPFDVDEDLLPLLRTDRTEYVFAPYGNSMGGMRVDVPYTFVNLTDATVYVGGCNGLISPIWDRWIDGEWVQFYRLGPVEYLSGNGDIAIRPGETLADTAFAIWGAPNSPVGGHVYTPGVLEGEYRLRWRPAGSPLCGGVEAEDVELLPERLLVSNTFRLRDP